METILTHATLVFVCRRDGASVLLARKARKVGKGMWNGYGGRIETGESPRHTAIRELEEESGLFAHVSDLKKRAIVDFHNVNSQGACFTWRVSVYQLWDWCGVEKSTEEMRAPKWFPMQHLPVCEMMLADRVWLPEIFKGRLIYAEAWYGPKQKTLCRPVEVSDWRGDMC